jgi:polar amino acid transport system substrate-binding protein
MLTNQCAVAILGLNRTGRIPQSGQSDEWQYDTIKSARAKTNWAKIIGAVIMIVAASATARAQNSDNATQRGTIVNSIPSDVVKDLAPTGKLRVAINLGNVVLAQKDAATGELKGITVDLAREVGRRLDVPVEFIQFDAAGKTFEALKAGGLDIVFLAIEPVRAAEVAFSPPYVIIEGVYLVPQDSPLKTIADIDRDGVRIAVNKGSAYDLFLTRTLKHAMLVRGDSGIDLFTRHKLDVAAGVKQPLVAFAKQHPDMRVMDERFMEIRQAMGTPKGRDIGARFLRGFVEEMKANGFVADALKRSNQPDAAVAPPATD